MKLERAAVIFGLIILILIVGFIIFKPEEEAKQGGGGPEGEQAPYGVKISLEEKQLIDTWIVENDLNQYGDPKDTVYIGGTPLFDERTGKRIDKYEYILKNHPDRPWRK